jgi:hypothetical protein
LFTAAQSQPVMAVKIEETVELYDGESSRRIGQLVCPPRPGGPLSCFEFSPDGQWLAAGVEGPPEEQRSDKLLWVWDLRDKLRPGAVEQNTGAKGQ